MSRGEGGIPYRRQRVPLVVHMQGGDNSTRTVCDTTAWRFQSTPNSLNITCRDCARILADRKASQ